MIALLDTNVLVRFLTCDRSQKYRSLYIFFESLEYGKMRVELKLIVLFQVCFVLKSFYKVPKTDIVTGIVNLFEYKGIIIKDKKNIRRMMEIWSDNTLDIVDCYLIACLEGDTQNLLYSYDHDFDKFEINRKEP
ncbi:MAG: PIN domain-containing protein [Bacteroidota bacterium]|nr:PIN domain-containing protein [Bacteroidota bacterium]